jgi:hypothetical protein
MQVKVTSLMSVGGKMLDFLLVLGQIPGTHFEITFTEILLVLLAFFLYRWEKSHRKEIRRWLKHKYIRTCVNIRKTKRRFGWFIKRQEKRVLLAQKRTKRAIALRIRRTKRVVIWSIICRYRKLKRAIKLRIRRSKRFILAITLYRFLRLKRQTKLRIRRSRRNLTNTLEKRQRRLNRQLAKRVKKIKNTKLVQALNF